MTAQPGHEGGRGGRGSELALRTASALVLGTLALGAAVLGGPLFAAFWLAAAFAVAAEWLGVTRAEPRTPLVGLTALGLAALVAALLVNASAAAIAGLGAAFALALAAAGGSGRDRAWAVAGFAYAGLLALVPLLVRGRPDLGTAAILWLFAVVWTTDVAAYFVGRRVGGPKLLPRISPKKTWSGFLGGVAAGTAAGALVAAAASRQGSALPGSGALLAAVAALAAVSSQIGDLAESSLKRRFAVKDSGALIPGHGGAMDRLDGFVAVLFLVGLALTGERLAGGAGTAGP